MWDIYANQGSIYEKQQVIGIFGWQTKEEIERWEIVY